MIRHWIKERFRMQNLNENRLGEVKGSAFWHGRAWLHRIWRDDTTHRNQIEICWKMPSHHVGMDLRLCGGDSNHDITVFFGCGLLALWITFENAFPKKLKNLIQFGSHTVYEMADDYWARGIGIGFHSGTIWFEIWNPEGHWSSRQPKWWAFNFCPADFFLGRTQCTVRPVSEHDTVVPMPEANYPARVKIQERIWKRPRWFATKRLESEIDIPNGVPIPGKGTMSYNCEDDAIHGSGGRYPTVESAVASVVESALERRKKYGGKNWRPEPLTLREAVKNARGDAPVQFKSYA